MRYCVVLSASKLFAIFFVEHNKDIKKLQTYCSQLDTNLLWLAEQILMNEIIIL